MRALTKFCLKMVQNYLPSAWILAVVLTFVVFGLALGLTDKSLINLVGYWGNGFSKMYVFAMQMVLVLITGYVLALTPFFKKVLAKLTSIPKTPMQALGITSLVSMIACYFSWSFGLVIGAILAKEIGKKVKGIHFPLLVAAAYGGEIIRGPSSSIPLVAATPGNFMTKLGASVVPVSQTLYAQWNIIMSIIILCALVCVYISMRPPEGEPITEFVDRNPEIPVVLKSKADMCFAERLENSYILNVLFGLLIFGYLLMQTNKFGFDLSLNLVILIFLTLGMFLHKSPVAFTRAVGTAIGACQGIVMQFPLYAGMAGIMTESGLVVVMSNWFVSISTTHTFPVWTFLSAGLVNIFVPSGGGQWIVQGPIMMHAAQTLNADIPQTIMAFAWGDAWTNQIQPFWALPLLGVAGLGARDIMGYCVVWTLVSGVIITGSFVILSFL